MGPRSFLKSPGDDCAVAVEIAHDKHDTWPLIQMDQLIHSVLYLLPGNVGTLGVILIRSDLKLNPGQPGQ